MLAEFGKFPFDHFTWGQLLLYYNHVSTLIEDHILKKAWEAQLAMFDVKKKCWVGSVRKLLFKNQPQEVAGFLPHVQLLLESTPQLTATRAW
jgi:hypothetical protein